MIITTTAVGFILLSLGLALCGCRFLRAYRKSSGSKTDGKDGKIGFLLALIFLGQSLQNGTMGFGALLFASNSEGLYSALLISNFLLALLAMLGAYTAYYIFLPNKSPYPATILSGILGFTNVAVTIISHPQPFITEQNGIELNINFLTSLMTFYTLFVSIGSTLYIFWKLFLNAKTREIKMVALTISILAFVGIAHTFIKLVLNYKAYSWQLYNIVLAAIGIAFIVFLAIVPAINSMILLWKEKNSGGAA